MTCPQCEEEKDDVTYETSDGEYICMDCYSSNCDLIYENYKDLTD